MMPFIRITHVLSGKRWINVSSVLWIDECPSGGSYIQMEKDYRFEVKESVIEVINRINEGVNR